MATISQSIEQENIAGQFSRAFQAVDMFAERLERVSASGEETISSRFANRSVMCPEGGDNENSGGGGKDAEKELKEMEKQAEELKNSWDKVGGAIKKALSFLSVQNVTSFVDEVFKLNNAQMTVELNLATALNNNGQSAEAFDAIRQKAAVISGETMYGDEAMIAGAAELSAYVSDPAAVMSMMDTLADYAAGMSGGGAVDSAAMTEYAAQLGQAMSGSFGGLEESGFELSAVQREIIENGSEMERALVLDEVISSSWDGLAESIRKTPVGMISAISNALRDLGEKIGAQITPKFMKLADSVYRFLMSSGVENVISTIVFLLGMTFDLLDWGVGVLQVITDNWELTGAVLLTVAGALGFYKLAMDIAMIKAQRMIKEQKKLIRIQNEYNFSLSGCPLFLVAAGFAVVAGAVALYTDHVNSAYDLSLSFSGMLGGTFMTVLAVLGNIIYMLWDIIATTIVFVWNIFADFANFIGNLFNDPIGAIARLFIDLFDSILGIIEGVAGAIGKLFGQDWSSGIAGFREDINKFKEENFGTGIEVVQKLDEDALSFKNVFGIDYTDYDEAFEAGYWLGDNMFNENGADEIGAQDGFDYESLFNGKSPLGTEEDPIHTEVDNDISIAEEDLKLLRDIAEARYVQNFVTLTPTVQVTGNTINEKVDVNSVVSEIEYRLESEFAASAEGVYC